MDYIELTIPVPDTETTEILTAFLADFPFESFTEEEGALKAYIQAEKLTGCKETVDEMLRSHGVTGTWIHIEPVNWNALWESGFEPVEIEGRCTILAPFHTPIPDGTLKVVIMPKMSFGTGHHATTWLMTAELTNPHHNWHGLRGVDMGSGTGILAIVAAKLGAAHVDAIDIDAWALENCTENIAVNDVTDRVTPWLGDASLLTGRPYDFVLANINRNILLADMPAYMATLSPGGRLIMSGIFEADIPVITEKALSLGLTPAGRRLRDGWALVVFEK